MPRSFPWSFASPGPAVVAPPGDLLGRAAATAAGAARRTLRGLRAAGGGVDRHGVTGPLDEFFD